MDEIIKIKCPFCGAVLAAKSKPGLEKKIIPCPVCKQKAPFSKFEKIVKSNRESTQIGGLNINTVIGKVTVLPNGESFQLREGRNVLGRTAGSSNADIHLPGSNRMSREHLIIDVRDVPGKGFVHYASLYKKETNETSIGHAKIEYGDELILKDGDIINFPGVDVIFEMPNAGGEMPDPEATAFRE